MSHRVAYASATSLALNFAFVVVGRGSFGQLMLVVLICLGSFAMLVGGGLMLGWNVSGGLRQEAISLVTTGAVGASCLVSFPISRLLHEYDVHRAKQFCENLRPELEHYRQLKGSYPDRLSQLPVPAPRPWLLRGQDFYRSKDGGYRFECIDSSSLFAGFDYDSKSRQWYDWD